MLKRIGTVFLSVAIMLSVPLAGYAEESNEWLDFTGDGNNSVSDPIQYLRGAAGGFKDCCFGEGEQDVIMPKSTETVRVPAMNVDNLVEWTRTYPTVMFEEYSGNPRMVTSCGAWTCIDNAGETAQLSPADDQADRVVVIDLGQTVDVKYIQWFRPAGGNANNHTAETRIAVSADKVNWSGNLFRINDTSRTSKSYWINAYLKDEDGDGAGIGTKIRYIKIYKDWRYGPYITGLRVWAAEPDEDVAPSVQRVDLTADAEASTPGRSGYGAGNACDATAMNVSKSDGTTYALYDQGTFDTSYSNAENADAANTPTQLKVDLDAPQILTAVRIALKSHTGVRDGVYTVYQRGEAHHNFEVIAVLNDNSEVLLHEQGEDYHDAMKLLTIDVGATGAKGKAVKSIIIRKTDENTAADVLGVSNILCIADPENLIKAEIHVNLNEESKVTNIGTGDTFASVTFDSDMEIESVQNAVKIIKSDGSKEHTVVPADASGGYASEFRIPYSELDSNSTYTIRIEKNKAVNVDGIIYSKTIERTFLTGVIIKGELGEGEKFVNLVAGRVPEAGAESGATREDLAALVDGSKSTGFYYPSISGGSKPQYYVWDLKNRYDLSAAEITVRYLKDTQKNSADSMRTKIAGANQYPITNGLLDTSKLTVLYDVGADALSVSETRYTDLEGRYRYVVVYRDQDSNYWLCLNEISIYGKQEAAYGDMTVLKEAGIGNDLKFTMTLDNVKSYSDGGKSIYLYAFVFDENGRVIDCNSTQYSAAITEGSPSVIVNTDKTRFKTAKFFVTDSDGQMVCDGKTEFAD